MKEGKDPQLPSIPEIPEEILTAIDDGTLVLFVGAGLSALMGYPVWTELANDMAKDAVQMGYISRSKKEVLTSGAFAPIQIITILSQEFDKAKPDGAAEHIANILNKTNPRFKKDVAIRIAGFLASYKAQIITTNADMSLEDAPALQDRKVCPSIEQYTKDYEDYSIVHLHGSIRDPKNMVFKSQDYAKNYAIGSRLGKTVEKILNTADKTILFIGYGLNEFELIRSLLDQDAPKVRRLFKLEPYLEKDGIKRELDEAYFLALNVHLLPYSREKNDYASLLDVLEAWDKDVQTKTCAGSVRKNEIISKMLCAAPKKASVLSIESILADADNIPSICKGLKISPFASSWILKLKNNPALFSPEKNIKCCVKIEDGRFRTSVWLGLNLIADFYRGGKTDERMDTFALNLLKRSMNLYKADSQSDPYLKLNSSSSILWSLFDILLSKPEFIEGVDFLSFLDVLLDSVTFDFFSVVDRLLRAKSVLLSTNPTLVFKIYEKLAKLQSPASSDSDYLVIPELIWKNPEDYYRCGKEYLLNTKEPFFEMGAMYEYKDPYGRRNALPYFRWMQISSVAISESTLKRDVLQLIRSENRVQNKMGLCLINLNFDRLSGVFFDNLQLFFNAASFYLDLKCLLVGRITYENSAEHREQLINTLETAEFGIGTRGKDKSLQILRNHLAGVLKAKGFPLAYSKEEKRDNQFAQNYGKGVYMVDYDREEDLEAFKETFLRGKSIDDIIASYPSWINGSLAFKETIHEGVADFLKDIFPNSFVEYLGEFDAGLCIHLINRSIIEKGWGTEAFARLLKKAIDLFNSNERFGEAVHSILYGLDVLLKQGKNASLVFDMLQALDYKRIIVGEYKDDDSIFQTCINEPLFQYLSLAVNPDLFKLIGLFRLEEIIRYFLKTSPSSKLKSILTSFYPFLFENDGTFAEEIGVALFDNRTNGTNASYPMLSLCTEWPDRLMDVLSKRTDFFDYISDVSKKGEVGTSKMVAFLHFLRAYIQRGLFVEVVEAFLKRGGQAEEALRTLSAWVEKGLDAGEMERIVRCIRSIKEWCESIEGKVERADAMISSLCRIMLHLGSWDEAMWELLKDLLSSFKGYSLRDLSEFVSTFAESKTDEITFVMDRIVEAYQPLSMPSGKVVEIFKKLADNPAFSHRIRKWRSALLKKDEGLADAIRPKIR